MPELNRYVAGLTGCKASSMLIDYSKYPAHRNWQIETAVWIFVNY
jgi:hypothetical protein